MYINNYAAWHEQIPSIWFITGNHLLLQSLGRIMFKNGMRTESLQGDIGIDKPQLLVEITENWITLKQPRNWYFGFI